MSKRPEHVAPATEVYSSAGAAKYSTSSRMETIQTQLSERCMELLALQSDERALILDIGCGTGYSTEVVTRAGHMCVGTDLARAMLEEAEVPEADLLQADAGEGLSFRQGVFDGAISVSAIQWLCNVDKTGHNPYRRLNAFFGSLYGCLRKSSRAALQFYPENSAQLNLITGAAARAGFSGGLLIDYPNSAKAKKYYLCITAGPPNPSLAKPVPMGVLQQNSVRVAGRKRQTGRRKRVSEETAVSRKDWVISKKDRRRRQGHETRPDSKYTGRKRRVKF